MSCGVQQLVKPVVRITTAAVDVNVKGLLFLVKNYALQLWGSSLFLVRVYCF